MTTPDFSRSKTLNNIPRSKLNAILEKIHSSNKSDDQKSIIITAFNRYFESNVPVDYWTFKMDSSFKGPAKLLEVYNDYSINLDSNFLQGKSLCLAGTHGVGKTTFSSCLLKKAIDKGYSALYTTLSDTVSALTSAPYEEKFHARKELCMVDFLVIDEFDSRFIPTENAAELYARTLEIIFRTRIQNKLPTILCTNSPNILETFSGTLKASIESLFVGYLKIIPVIGQDFRKVQPE